MKLHILFVVYYYAVADTSYKLLRCIGLPSKLRLSIAVVLDYWKGCVFCQGAGSLSYNAVTGSSVQRLATVAADHFIKVLDIEGEKICISV